MSPGYAFDPHGPVTTGSGPGPAISEEREGSRLKACTQRMDGARALISPMLGQPIAPCQACLSAFRHVVGLCFPAIELHDACSGRRSHHEMSCQMLLVTMLVDHGWLSMRTVHRPCRCAYAPLKAASLTCAEAGG